MNQKAITLSGRIINLREGDLQQLAASLGGRLLLPSSSGYTDARQIWNGMYDRQPALIVQCASVGDVSQALGFAVKHNLLLAVRGGGHHAAGYAVCDGGMVIDLSPMNSVNVDPDSREARVGGGARWKDVDAAAQPFGLAVPGGQVSSTGVGGLTLGGGLGWLRRKYGLSCDSLLSAEVVTAEGDILVASQNEHADLFWALRGGGGNFGVVTTLNFRLHPAGPLVWIAYTAYPVERASDILPAWFEYMHAAPEEITCDAVLCSLPALPEIPPKLRGRPALVIQGIDIGGISEGERRLNPLRNLGEPLVDLSSPVLFEELQQSADELFPGGSRMYYWSSMYLEIPDPRLIEAILRCFAARPSPLSQVVFWRLGGAIDRLPASATAYGHRGLPYLLTIDAAWGRKEQVEENVAWARASWEAVSGMAGKRIYPNFPGTGKNLDVQERSAFGPNIDRLRAVKRQYDPENHFRGNLNIRPDESRASGLSPT